MDVDKALAALEAPEIKLFGTVYTCRTMSVRERIKLGRDWDEVDWNDFDQEEAALRSFFDACEAPADEIFKLPELMMWEVIEYLKGISAGVVNPALRVELSKQNVNSESEGAPPRSAPSSESSSLAIPENGETEDVVGAGSSS